MGRDRALVSCPDQLIQPTQWINDAYRRRAHGSAGAVTIRSDPRWVTKLNEAPEGHLWVEGFLALQELSSDRLVSRVTFPEERSRHCQSLFGIVRSLADAPFISLTGITGDNVSRSAVE